VKEYNIVTDIPSARKLVDQWPTPIDFSGFEIGIAIEYPSASIERDYAYVARHPAAEAYVAYEPPPHNRPSWDLTAVLQAVRPDRGYFGLSLPGRVAVDDQGFTHFAEISDGAHRYFTVAPEQVIRVKETFACLASEPPHESSASLPVDP
jgi:hypothetical protein